MKSKSTAIFVLVTVIAVLALVVAGCGGTTSTTAAADVTATTAADVTATTAASGGGDIPIGFLTSYTGELGAYGVPWYSAGKMAVDDINAAGGVLGRKIALSTEDDRTSVEEGIKAARKLIGANGVIAIAGPTSDIVVAIYPICKDNKVFLSSNAAGTARLDAGHGEWFYRTVPSDTFEGEVAARIMIDDGYKEIAVMYENDEGRKSIASAVTKEFLALGGKIVAEVPFTPRQPTYSAELKKIAGAKPQMVWLGAGQESGSVLLKNAKQSGYDWKWMVSSDLNVPEMFTLVGNDVMEGIITETASAETDNQYYIDWAARFQELFNQEPAGAYQSNSYDQMIIMALAMQKAGVASGEAISQNYHKVTDANPNATIVHTYADGLAALTAGKEIKYEGVSGPCTFNASGNTVGSFMGYTAQSGKWVAGKFWPASTFLQ